METHQLIGLVPQDLFRAIFEDSPRQIRQAVIGVTGTKKKKKRRSLKSQLAAKEAEQARALTAAQERLAEEDMDQFAEEVIRNYLGKTPDMLIAFLDHLGVEHQDGYTNDLEFIKAMTPEQVSGSVEHLVAEFPIERITLYLCYLEVPGITEVPAIRETLLAWGWDPDAEQEEEDDEDAEEEDE